MDDASSLRQRACSLGLCLLTSACGPLTLPMVTRLDAQEQAEVDQVWERIAAADKADMDHGLLLDLILYANLFQYGVDSLHMSSEKRVSGGLVLMEIEYEREDPSADRFRVAHLADDGSLLREELYDRAEIEAHLGLLFDRLPSCEQVRRTEPDLSQKRCAKIDVAAAEQAAHRVLVEQLLSPLFDDEPRGRRPEPPPDPTPANEDAEPAR